MTPLWIKSYFTLSVMFHIDIPATRAQITSSSKKKNGNHKDFVIGQPSLERLVHQTKSEESEIQLTF